MDSNFDFDLKPRRPLWKELLVFTVTVMGFWGTSHVVLNYGAYEQIVTYKAENLAASLIGASEVSAAQIRPIPAQRLRPVKKKRAKEAFRRRTLKPRNNAQTLISNMEVYPSDNRIYIPRIDKNVPLVSVPQHKNWENLENNIQSGLQKGVVVHPVSRDPGDFGNFFVTGHSSYYAWDKGKFKDVFALLHEVDPGDTVEVYWEGKKYVYLMREEKVVSPTEISVLNQPKNKSIITLMTCTPVGTNKNRLILRGELISS